MSEFWNCLDFLQISKCCQFIGFYIESIHFLEIWYSHQNFSKNSKNLTSFQLLKSNPVVTELILNAYKQIGEKSVLNSNLIYLIDASDQFKYFDQESNHTESLYSYDEFLSKNESTPDMSKVLSAQVGLVNSLKSNGLHFILDKYLTGLKNGVTSFSNNSELIDLKYYTSWKLNSWSSDLSELTSNNNNDHVGFNKHFYDSLNSYTLEETTLGTSNCNSHKFIKTLLSVDNCDKFLVNNKEFESGLNQIQHYYLEYLKSFTFILSNESMFKEVLNDLNVSTFKYENVFVSNFTGTKINAFKLVDDLISIKLALVRPLLVSKINHVEKIKDHISDLYGKQIDNAIIHKRFQVCLEKFFV
jgi:hypothetical protein